MLVTRAAEPEAACRRRCPWSTTRTWTAQWLSSMARSWRACGACTRWAFRVCAVSQAARRVLRSFLSAPSWPGQAAPLLQGDTLYDQASGTCPALATAFRASKRESWSSKRMLGLIRSKACQKARASAEHAQGGHHSASMPPVTGRHTVCNSGSRSAPGIVMCGLPSSTEWPTCMPAAPEACLRAGKAEPQTITASTAEAEPPDHSHEEDALSHSDKEVSECRRVWGWHAEHPCLVSLLQARAWRDMSVYTGRRDSCCGCNASDNVVPLRRLRARMSSRMRRCRRCRSWAQSQSGAMPASMRLTRMRMRLTEQPALLAPWVCMRCAVRGVSAVSLIFKFFGQPRRQHKRSLLRLLSWATP